MPFHLRDVLGSYPSAQLAAVDRDTEIFKYGQIFQNTKNPNRRLVAARTLAGISPSYQEARIEQLAGDNFSQKAFQDEQREAFALQKKYIQDRTEYMDQKTSNRLLRGSLVQALSSGGRTTGDRTPFADLDLDENFDIAGRGSSASGTGSSTPQSRISVRQMAEFMGSMELFPSGGGLSESFWEGRGSGAASVSGESEGSWLSQEYGMGVEPINLNIDPLRLQRIQATRAASSEERARQEVVGSLVGEMVSVAAGFEAQEQEEERQARVRSLMYETGIMDVQNPADMTEDQLRLVARTREAQARRGFFGRAEMASEQTFLEQPLEIESAEMGMEPGGRSLQEVLGTVDQFGSRGSLALASGGGAVRRGRPVESQEQKQERKDLIREAESITGTKLSIAEARQIVTTTYGSVEAFLNRREGRQEGRAAEMALARSKGVRGLARRVGALNPQEEEKAAFSLFD